MNESMNRATMHDIHWGWGRLDIQLRFNDDGIEIKKGLEILGRVGRRKGERERDFQFHLSTTKRVRNDHCRLFWLFILFCVRRAFKEINKHVHEHPQAPFDSFKQIKIDWKFGNFRNAFSGLLHLFSHVNLGDGDDWEIKSDTSRADGFWLNFHTISQISRLN